VTALDWSIVAIYFLVSAAIGVALSARASRSMTDYFVGGRSLPWWLAGTSMVATTFAADTPLAVTELVVKYGVAGNWLWWNMVMSGILTVFFYARLWRRAGVITDVELTELRYGGKPAALLRGFRAGYLALPINLIVMGWVNVAMAAILGGVLDVNQNVALAICFVVTAAYSTVAGILGVVWTDFFQFVLAMIGCVMLAIFAVDAVGGMATLQTRLAEPFGSTEAALAFLPATGAVWMPSITLVTYLAVNWWASWYPGAEPGGGGYIAQRIFSARTERDGLLATLWFNVAHYAVRPWPWILVALASTILYPGLADPKQGYIRAMVDLLPPGLLGLAVAGFAAAYMSTISTQLNWGASYLVNDLYVRFVRPDASEKQLVGMSRLATVALMVLSLVVTQFMTSIEGAWRFLIALSAGTGLVAILRWYWWRINAWSEISAMVASLVLSVVLWRWVGLDAADPREWALIVLATTAGCTVVWLAVTYLTRPESPEVLQGFYRRVRPGGRGWAPVAASLGLGGEPVDGGPLNWTNWVAGVTAVYTSLFGVGSWIFGQRLKAALMLGVAFMCFVWIARNIRPARASIEQEPVVRSPEAKAAR
jgi:SSS family solute:Na+ symporter